MFTLIELEMELQKVSASREASVDLESFLKDAGEESQGDDLEQRLSPDQTLWRIVGAETIYGPAPLQGTDLWISDKILAQKSSREEDTSSGSQDEFPPAFDVTGKVIIPGLVDIHSHLIGGGGEAGFESCCPEASHKNLFRAGVTTAVGVLGFDGLTKSPERLLAKARALQACGLTCYMCVGSYRYPPCTLTGEILKDISYVREVIGVKIALSDRRSNHATSLDLARLTADIRSAGMISGKRARLYCHMGDGPDGLNPLFNLVKNYDVPPSLLLPTHVARNERLISQSREWLDLGGRIDLSADPARQIDFVVQLRRECPEWLNRVSISSDSFGSHPVFDVQGELIEYSVMQPSVLLQQLHHLHFQHDFTLEECIRLLSTNPADAYGLAAKGRLDVGCDADMLILDPTSLQIESVIAKGRLVMTKDWTVSSLFGD